MYFNYFDGQLRDHFVLQLMNDWYIHDISSAWHSSSWKFKPFPPKIFAPPLPLFLGLPFPLTNPSTSCPYPLCWEFFPFISTSGNHLWIRFPSYLWYSHIFFELLNTPTATATVTLMSSFFLFVSTFPSSHLILGLWLQHWVMMT